MRVLAIMLLLLASNLAAQSRYEVACRADVFHLSLQNSIQLEGEINDKKNPKIVEITNEIGLSRGSAYCQATQYYTFSQACKSLKLDKKHNPISRNGLAQSSFNVAVKAQKQTKYEPAVGDLIIWKKKQDRLWPYWPNCGA